MSESYKNIKFCIEDNLAQLTFNRPEKLNSFNGQMFAEIRSAFKQIHLDNDVRCLFITGAGRAFCAGQDLSDPQVAPGGERPDFGSIVQNNYNPLVRAIASLEMPVVCAVNGVAAGAGSSIALGCDLVFAARSAKFIQSFSKIGLIPDSGGTWYLPRLIGRARSLGLALLGETISAEQAEDWGLIWKCVDDDLLMDEAIQTAKHLATQPTRGLSLIKQAMAASNQNTFDEQLDLERDFMAIAGRTDDYQEGVTAFIEKRAAKFTGK